MVLYAVNIHTGGGKTLLKEFIAQSPFGRIELAILDQRMQLTPEEKKLIDQVIYVLPTLKDRILADYRLNSILLKLHSIDSVILFFGNLPPIFKIHPKWKTQLYLQNCYLLSQVPLPTYKIKTFLRLFIERLWLKVFIQNITEVFVQSDWMVALFLKDFKNIPVKLLPIHPQLNFNLNELKKMSFAKKITRDFDSVNTQMNSTKPTKNIDFLFVGSLNPHKGFHELVQFINTYDFTSLSSIVHFVVVLDELPQEKQLLNLFKISTNLKIQIKFQLSYSEMMSIYSRSRYLIILSKYESYYLPAYEALFYECKLVIHKNTPYLSHDIFNQSEVFESSIDFKKLIDKC